jgi:predicted oxidoreductase
VAPFPLPIGRHLRSGYLLKGKTLGDLARKAGIDAANLDATVRDVNVFARDGKDPAFGKGSKAYNRYQGDALHAPNPCIKPIEKGPFYAIKVVVGDLGTYAGLTTDEHSRVLGADRQPIGGLYAVGNDIASIMGGNYPGAGITLGPALTFGHIAGCHLAGAPTGLGADQSADPESKSRSGPSVEDDGTVVMGEVA